MRLFYDLNSDRLVRGLNSPAALEFNRIELKRGTRAGLEFQFIRPQQSAEELPGSPTLKFGVKSPQDFTGDYLVSNWSGTEFAHTLTGSGVTAVYTLPLVWDTDPLNELLAAAAALGQNYVDLPAELKWISGTTTRATLDFTVRVFNDYNRGTEGFPDQANPNPAPEDFEVKAMKGEPEGYAPLDEDSRVPLANMPAGLTTPKADLVGGTVPANQLPSYVDDVIEAADFASMPASGESGKIYITTDDQRQYRWTGSVYVQVSSYSPYQFSIDSASAPYSATFDYVDFSTVGHGLRFGTLAGSARIYSDDHTNGALTINGGNNNTRFIKGINLSDSYGEIRGLNGLAIETNNGLDIRINTDAGGKLVVSRPAEFRSGTNPQSVQVYNTYSSGGTNYERALVGWSSNTLVIETQSGGSGVGHDIAISATGNSSVFLKTNSVNRWKIGPTGHLLADSDNAYDIGTTDANRPRDVFIYRNLTAGNVVKASYSVTAGDNGYGFFVITNRAYIRATADGVLEFTNWAENAYCYLIARTPPPDDSSNRVATTAFLDDIRSDIAGLGEVLDDLSTGGGMLDPLTAYVRKTVGSDSTGDGTPGKPFLTAQAAFNAGFLTLNLGEGDFGSLDIGTSTDGMYLTIQGKGRNKTKLSLAGIIVGTFYLDGCSKSLDLGFNLTGASGLPTGGEASEGFSGADGGTGPSITVNILGVSAVTLPCYISGANGGDGQNAYQGGDTPLNGGNGGAPGMQLIRIYDSELNVLNHVYPSGGWLGSPWNGGSYGTANMSDGVVTWNLRNTEILTYTSTASHGAPSGTYGAWTNCNIGTISGESPTNKFYCTQGNIPPTGTL